MDIRDVVEHADWHMAVRLQKDDDRVSLGSRLQGGRKQAAPGGNGTKRPGKERLANTRRLEDFWGKK